METLFQDLRHATRMLLRSPGFTLVAVLSLALGISATSTIFSAINAVLLRRRPYPNRDRLVTVLNTPLKQRGNQYPVSTADLVHWRKDNRVFEQIEVSQWGTEMNALSGGGVPERVGVQPVTAGLLPLFGVQPILGRVFSEEEADRSENYSTAISYEFWQRHFAGDPKVLGRTFFVDNSPAFVGAVLPVVSICSAAMRLTYITLYR
jgi:putative ABC transport system permease protein